MYTGSGHAMVYLTQLPQILLVPRRVFIDYTNEVKVAIEYNYNNTNNSNIESFAPSYDTEKTDLHKCLGVPWDKQYRLTQN